MDGYISLGHASCPDCQDPRHPGIILAALMTNITTEEDQLVYFRASGAPSDFAVLQESIADPSFVAQWAYIATWPCITSSADVSVVSYVLIYLFLNLYYVKYDLLLLASLIPCKPHLLF